MSHGSDATRVIVIALFANLGIAIAKFTGAFISKSAALLAESVHSLVDCTNQGLLLIGNKKAKRLPSETHPLGYGREAFFWSFIVAILLFSLGGLFAIYEGVHKLDDHSEPGSPLLGLGILVVSMVLEAYSFLACWKEVRAQNTYGDLWTWFKKTTSSELLVVFTEDAAAMLGLILATASLLLTWVTGNPIWDAIGSILVGVLLVIVAILLAVEIKSLLVGESPSTDYKKHLNARIAELIPEGRLFNLIALQIGPNEVMLSYKLSPGNIKDVKQLLVALNALERDIKQKYPEVKWQFCEPDLSD